MSRASRNQYGHPKYRDDNWQDTTIQGGTKVYRLDFLHPESNDIDGSSYYIDEQALIDGDYISFDSDGNQHFNVEKYCDDYQIAPHERGGYKNHVSVFEVPEGTSMPAEEGYAENNWEYGHGGGRQLFIESENEALLQPISEPIIIDDHLRKVDSAQDMLDNHETNDDVYKNASKSPMQEQAAIADEVKASNPQNTTETLKNTADQANLPATDQSNTQGNEQTQNEDNSMNVQ